jgi:hypothetical protein
MLTHGAMPNTGKQLAGLLVICGSCLLGCIESTEAVAATVFDNLGAPTASPLFKMHSLEAGRLTLHGKTIGVVLAARNEPKIVAPIVEPIAVDVVNGRADGSAEDKAMQVVTGLQSILAADAAFPFAIASRVNRAARAMELPIPAAQKARVLFVDEKRVRPAKKVFHTTNIHVSWGNCNDWHHPDLPHVEFGRCKDSPSDEARRLYSDGGVKAVWRAVGAL